MTTTRERIMPLDLVHAYILLHGAHSVPDHVKPSVRYYHGPDCHLCDAGGDR